MQPPALAPRPPRPPPPAPASSLNPHRLSTQSTQSSASAGSSTTNGRLSPASTRLRIDVPPNERFLRSSLNGPAHKGKARATAGDEAGGEGRSSSRSSSEYGLVGGGGTAPSRPPTSPARADDDEDPPRTPITLPRSPRHSAAIQSDEDDEPGRDDFHDARDDWLGGGGALLVDDGVGLGLGIAGPSSLPAWRDESQAPSSREQREPSVERKARAHASSGSDEVDPSQRRGSLPFPSRAFAPVPPDVPSYDTAMSTDLPSRPPAGSHASRSTTGSHESSVSSTVSVPRTPPVDLVLPNRTLGPYETVANGPMASLAAGNAPTQQRSQPSPGGGARSFFSNLLHRSPRQHPSPRLGSPSASSDSSPNPGLPRSPSAPHGWQHPSVASLQSNDAIHSRSTSMPLLSNGEPAPRDSRDLYRPSSHSQGTSTAHSARRTPRSIAAATFAGLTRSASLRGTSSSPRLGGASTAATPPSAAASPVPTFDFATPPLPSTATAAAARPEPDPPSLASIGLSLVPLTQPLALSRSGQPLCGAVLDGRFLLIGTTIGLDFLPLPLPGSLPLQHLGSGGKKRKDTRKPISLIKRTRFKELAILSERSNILLAIAGRNDHIRVYALDGIRAMIDKKMHEVDARDGYPLALAKPSKPSVGLKGKERARTTSDTLAPPLPTSLPPHPASAAAASDDYQFPPTAAASAAASAAPADLSTPRPRQQAALTATARRRPTSWHQAAANPTSSVRISRQPSSGSIVRAVPTNPPVARPTDSTSPSGSAPTGTPTLRSQKSREFVAGRRGSTASIPRRRSRADLDTPAESRRTSAYSTYSRRGSAWLSGEGVGVGGTGTSARRASVPAVPRLPGAAPSANGQRSESSTDASASAATAKRMQPRAPVKAQQAPHERSPTSDLADFLRDSGPEMRSVEMDNLLASARERRRSSVAENLLSTAPGAHLFPAGTTSSRSLFGQSQAAAHLAGLALYTMGDKGDAVEMLCEPQLDGRRGPSVSDDALVPPPVPPKHEARGPTTPRLEAGQPSPSMELAALLRDTAPDEADDGRGGAGAAAAAATAARQAALERLEARSVSDNSSPPDDLRGGSPTAQGVGGSPSSKASKRWTMSALGSKLLSRPAPAVEDPTLKQAESSSSSPSQLGRRASAGGSSTAGRWEMVPGPPSLPHPVPPPPITAPAVASPTSSASCPATSDRKRRPAAPLHRDSVPSIAPSSRAPPDAHPASSSSPLEYVKLARTKGARMLRAVETKKRTYLAVLSGEEAERIELFTGSRSISLSLNRTFVLPETPRSIEFQLQGDDLVDIYLVYPESIFALEPSTVRVREVGVGRGERRARRERDRQLRTLATAASEALPAEGAEEAPPAELQSTLHPADHARQEQDRPGTPATDAAEVDDVAVPLYPARRSPSPSPAPSPLLDSAQPPATPPPGYDLPPRPRTQSSVSSPAHDPPFDRTQPSSTAPPPRGKLPYSTFQQLPFVPPVPSSTLSSAWTIPPTYADVVGGSPPQPSSSDDEDSLGPAITVTSTNGVDGAAGAQPGGPPLPPRHAGLDIPLLSPVSLLGGAAIRHSGPPGLFFVSKGSSISGIVTADGKSIIKRPLIWSSDQGPVSPDAECLQRLEVLVVGGTRTVVVKLSPTDVKAISVDGGASPFSAAVSVTRSNARGQVNFLATHRMGQQLLFAHTIGPSTTILCLAPCRA